jgi:hypothetical protein
MSKKLVTSICLCVLAFSSFALTSTASAQWKVGGTVLTGTEKLLELSVVHETWKIKFAGVTISCVSKNLETVSPQIEAGDKSSASSLIFKECSVNARCTLGSSTISTVPVVATAVLGVSPGVNLTFKPKTKTVFTTIKFSGEECALLGIQPVTGTAKVLAPTGQTEKETQLLQAKVDEASGELKVGSNSAELKGSTLRIVTTHRTWGFV